MYISYFKMACYFLPHSAVAKMPAVGLEVMCSDPITVEDFLYNTGCIYTLPSMRL